MTVNHLGFAAGNIYHILLLVSILSGVGKHVELGVREFSGKMKVFAAVVNTSLIRCRSTGGKFHMPSDMAAENSVTAVSPVVAVIPVRLFAIGADHGIFIREILFGDGVVVLLSPAAAVGTFAVSREVGGVVDKKSVIVIHIATVAVQAIFCFSDTIKINNFNAFS